MTIVPKQPFDVPDIAPRVLFDGAHLKRKGLLMGWLVATAGKAMAFFSAGVLFSFLVPAVEGEGKDGETEESRPVGSVG